MSLHQQNSIIKIIYQLKLYKLEQISYEDCLYILNKLFSHHKMIKLEHIRKYIETSRKQQIQKWKQFQSQKIYENYLEQVLFFEKHYQNWQKQQIQSQKKQSLASQQVKKLKKILLQKSITKDELIDNYLQEIRRNKTIINKTNTKQSKDINQKQKQKYLINIQLLQTRIALMRNKHKFDQQKTQFKKTQQIGLYKRQNVLDKIVQDFQFKKNIFSDQQNSLHLQQFANLNRKIFLKKKHIIKKLYQIFQFYSKQNHQIGQTFQKNHSLMMKMDLKLFLKYIKSLKIKINKQFELDNENKFSLKSKQLQKLFKNNAINQRYLNFVAFVKINQQIFIINMIKNNLSLSQMLKNDKMLFTPEKPYESMSTNLQILLNQQITLKELQSDKINRQELININEQLDEFKRILNDKNLNTNLSNNSTVSTSQFSNTSKTRKSLRQDDQNPQSPLGNIIDKTLAQYESSRKQIYKNFKKKNNRQNLVLPQKNSSLQIINSDQGNIDINQIKVIKNRKVHKSVDNLRKVKLNSRPQTRLGRTNRKNSQLFSQSNKNDSTLIVSNKLNKYLFDVIVQEANQQESQQQSNKQLSISKKFNTNQFSKNRSKSTGNILIQKNRGKSSMDNIFTLPKLIRLSDQRMKNQSIIKSLDYLYDCVGRKQESKIKKLLDLDNIELQKVNHYENQYLKDYFQKQKSQMDGNQKLIKLEQLKKHEIMCRKCPKFQQDSYEPFMKFS